MVYITGDIHGDPEKIFEFDKWLAGTEKWQTEKAADEASEPLAQEQGFKEDDFVIICGDFGLVWDWVKKYPEETLLEKERLDGLASLPCTVLFVDGNHENFTRLESYPEEDWHGGKVHRIRENVLHLERGYVFDIDGKSVFAFGGASSHDISDGVLDPDKPEDCEKIYAWRKDRSKMYRIKDVSWWKRELPSEEEMQRGIANLDACGWKVDVVVSHCCASSSQFLLGGGLFRDTDVLTEYFEDIRARLNFGAWYFGHYHVDRNVNAKERCLYEKFDTIRTGGCFEEES